jgi:hypothetical protein
LGPLTAFPAQDRFLPFQLLALSRFIWQRCVARLLPDDRIWLPVRHQRLVLKRGVDRLRWPPGQDGGHPRVPGLNPAAVPWFRGQVDPEPARDPAQHGPRTAMVARDKGGRSWRIGTDAEVSWIANGTTVGTAITSAMPAVFEAYATVVLPPGGEGQEQHDGTVLALLTQHTRRQPWWLGYLATGADDIGRGLGL